jgi:hypothetical protein
VELKCAVWEQRCSGAFLTCCHLLGCGARVVRRRGVGAPGKPAMAGLAVLQGIDFDITILSDLYFSCPCRMLASSGIRQLLAVEVPAGSAGQQTSL